jgi:hypothetical protein
MSRGFQLYDVDFQASSGQSRTSFQLRGTADLFAPPPSSYYGGRSTMRSSSVRYGSSSVVGSLPEFHVKQIKLSQIFSFFRRQLTVTPCYQVIPQRTELLLSYEVSDTVTISADTLDLESMDTSTRFTLRKQFTDVDEIIPSINMMGDWNIEYRRTLLPYARFARNFSTTGTFSALYQPRDEMLDLSFQDGPWTARFSTPCTTDMRRLSECRVDVRRTVDLSH